ncbi:hypothetical protein F4813DRAFT_381965 [Daldinia decipiens]|uniref:uncharacterized protein n=1 Tax=Daldinia decipiens TaxID=326647 RepID=UPI0020C4BA0E|nr:uncharacterized protein F4813DRAFT_381965 [Daldinia decipiens]KAI1655691.1 hypothetical protein F4813DRAFT_381965 [Daldinia decipiens]
METSIQYVARTSNLESEKAFSTDIPVDHVEGARRGNTRPDHRPVTVTAIENSDEFKLDVYGFCVVHGSTHLDPDLASINKKAVQNAYWHEIEATLHKNFPRYSRIEAFDLTVRKRDADFPGVLRVYRDKYEQPSAIAHCDWSQQGAITVLEWCFPRNEGFWEDKEFDMLK